jgi:hypothetical protein
LSHWLSKLGRLSTVPDGSLKKMAIVLGANPRYFYTNHDLAGCDLRGQDLTEMDLTGTNIEFALIDQATQIDPEFDPRFVFESEYVEFKVTRDLARLMANYSEHAKYRYEAWAYKRVLEYAAYEIKTGKAEFYRKIIHNSEYLKAALEFRVRYTLLIKKFQVYHHVQQAFHEFFGEGDASEIYNEAILLGLIGMKVQVNPNYDYSQLRPNDLLR